MGCKAGRCNKTSTTKYIFIVTPPLEGWPSKVKEPPSPHEVRLTLLDTTPVFQCLIIYYQLITIRNPELHSLTSAVKG